MTLAMRASSAARRLMALAAKDAHRVQEIGRTAGTTLRVHQLLRRMMLKTIDWRVITGRVEVELAHTLNLAFRQKLETVRRP